MKAILFSYLAFTALTFGVQVMAYVTYKLQGQKH
jgi:hypothetical protein